MRAGLLRHRIRFESADETVRAGGARTKVWNDLGTRWASIDPLKGDEIVSARTVLANATHKILIRKKPPGLPAKATQLRAVFGTRIFHLASALSWQERGIFTTITAEERLGGTP